MASDGFVRLNGQSIDLYHVSPGDVEALSAELLAAREMREVLAEVEWQGDVHTYAACPCCHGLQPDQLPEGDEFAHMRAQHREGHSTDCRLARLVGGGK